MPSASASSSMVFGLVPVLRVVAALAVALGISGSHALAETSTSLVATPKTSRIGQTVTLTAKVSGVVFSNGGLSGGSKIAAGESHTCAVKQNGTVACWGANWVGQLGDGTTTDRATPVEVGGLTNVVSLAAGLSHTCALKLDKTVECWGFNGNGELGNGGDENSLAPTLVGGLSDVAAIAVGGSHSCALKLDGTIACWGSNTQFQLGVGFAPNSLVPMSVLSGPGGEPLPNVTAIARGHDHTCALKQDGTAVCWGRNNSGQLGDGSTAVRQYPVAVVVDDSPAAELLSGVTALSGGGAHTCARLAGGKLACWGSNAGGQLGDGTTVSSPTPVAVRVGVVGGPELEGVDAIVVGEAFSCALVASEAKCWGNNGSGQLGNDTLIDSPFPVDVVGLSDAASIGAGWYHACALTNSGAASCWGWNGSGQIGDGTNGVRQHPDAVIGLSDFTSLVSGGLHSCGLHQDGTASCWGFNALGQLGNGTTDDAATPVAVAGVADATALSTGLRHTCALLSDRSVACWGSNQFGQLGNGLTDDELSPVAVAALSDVVAIEAGNLQSCALLDDGPATPGHTASCWGYNGNGQFGNGTLAHSTTPVTVEAGAGGGPLMGVTAMAVGVQHACALLEGGAVKCWGGNSSGQLGDGTTTQRLYPVEVAGIDGVSMSATAIAAGSLHTCALLSAGDVVCWGNNTLSELGDGSTVNSAAPVAVMTGLPSNPVALQGVTALSSKARHSCAVVADGTARCWGYNYEGTIGDGTLVDRPLAVAVVHADGSPLTGASSVAPGGSHTCALIADGTAMCWGGKYFGQLGDGTNAVVQAPAAVRHPATITGTVTFRNGGKVLGSDNVQDGVASLVTNALPAGLHSLTAAYGGNADFAASTSGKLAHLVTGTAGADRLTGNSGADTLIGLGGNDVLIGRGGDDRLDGGGGADRIDGGTGRDLMTGGKGRDHFIFRRPADSPVNRPDVITDFKAAQGDRIDLSVFDRDSKTKGLQRPSIWLGSRAFTGRAGEVRFVGKHSRLEIDANGNRRANFRVVLRGVRSLPSNAVKLR